MPWNRKTTRKSRHARNRARTPREQLARQRAFERCWPRALRGWAAAARDVIFKPTPWLYFLNEKAKDYVLLGEPFTIGLVDPTLEQERRDIWSFHPTTNPIDTPPPSVP